MRVRLTRALVALLVAGSSSAAIAQATSDPASTAVEDVGAIPEIVVTAQKRAQSLQDVPVSISVVQAEAFSERNVTQLSDLPTLVPGFEFVRAPAQTTGLTFRGLGPQAGNLSFDSSIGMFVDGVFLGNIRAFNQTLFDIQRAEFIKGSQSALLGKNSTVGALSIVNNTPAKRTEAKVEAGAEVDDGGYFVDAALNGALSETLFARVSGRYSYQKGYIRNVATDHKGPENTDWGVRGQLLYDDKGPFNALLSYQHTDNEQIGIATQCVPPGFAFPGIAGAPFPPGTSIDAVCGDGLENDVNAAFSSDPRLKDGDDNYRTKLDITSATLNYDLGPVTLTAITAGLWSRTFNAADFDFDVKDDNLWVRDEKYRQFTQEIRLTSNDTSAPIQYIVGAFYVKSRWTLIETRIWGIPDFPPVPLPGFPPAGQLFNGGWVDDFRQSDRTISAFGQLTWKPVDKLTFNLGARYSHDRKVVDFGRAPDTTNLTAWNTVIQAPFVFQRLDPAVDNLLSGSLAAQYEFNRDVTVYASVSRSGKAGGYGEFAGIPVDPALPQALFNGIPLSQGNPNRDSRVKPERANAYEAGVKANLFDRHLSIDAALFWTDIFNLQQLTFTGQFIVTNDRVRNRGGEVNFTFRPTDNLTLSGAATYAKVRDIRNKQDSVNAPRFSASGSAEYRIPFNADLELKVRGGFRHRSSKYNQLGEAERDGAFTTANFGARLESVAGWWLNANVENAFNAKGANFGFPGPDPFIVSFKALEPLRRVTLSAGIKF
jgi:iron complex outermembrane receptor protein